MLPLNFPISFTNLDEITWLSGSDIRKTVSILLFNCLFIPANWNSYSKSETARNPLNIIFALCFKHKAKIIFRGLRAVSDFEYEFQLAGMNRNLDKSIETVFLMADVDKQVISSKFVKEIAKLNGKIDNFVTKSVIKVIQDKLW